MNLEKSKCKNLQNKVLTFLSSPHCEKMQIIFYNAYEMEMFFFFCRTNFTQKKHVKNYSKKPQILKNKPYIYIIEQQ